MENTNNDDTKIKPVRFESNLKLEMTCGSLRRGQYYPLASPAGYYNLSVSDDILYHITRYATD